MLGILTDVSTQAACGTNVMANTIQSLKWSDVAVPAVFVSQYKRFLEALEEKQKQRWGMAPSLMMYTKEYVSDNAKSKAKVKHH